MKKYGYLLVTLFLAAINFNFILKPLNLVTGGTQGLALLLHHILPFTPSTIILIINVIMLIISYFLLPKQTTYSAIIATFVYPFFVKITNFLPEIFFFTMPLLLSSIMAGIVCGITGGYIYKLGFSSGGLTIVNLLILKYCHIKIAIINFIINALIILFGCFLFGMKKAFYSIIVILIGSSIIHFILSTKNRKRINF